MIDWFGRVTTTSLVGSIVVIFIKIYKFACCLSLISGVFSFKCELYMIAQSEKF